MSDEPLIPNDEIKKKTGLKDFVDDHQKIISVIGVFIALGLLWKTITPSKVVPFVAYLCFFITIPLFISVIVSWYKTEGTFLLRVFVEMFFGILLLTVSQLIFGYPEHFESLITYSVPIIFFLLAIHIPFYIGKAARKGLIPLINWVGNRKEKRGWSREQRNEWVVNYINPRIQNWYSGIEAGSVIVGLVISFSVILLSSTIRSFVHPSIDLIIERNDENVETPKEPTPASNNY